LFILFSMPFLLNPKDITIIRKYLFLYPNL
jgi:hypothetical protein